MKTLQNNAWILILIVGLGFFAYAFDNLITIPALDPADPDRGWAWLTTHPQTIAYIKFYFRILGVSVLALGIFTAGIAITGYRRGERWAWYSLLYIPIHILLYAALFPWTVPILGVFFAVAAAGLILPYRRFFPKEKPA